MKRHFALIVAVAISGTAQQGWAEDPVSDPKPAGPVLPGQPAVPRSPAVAPATDSPATPAPASEGAQPGRAPSSPNPQPSLESPKPAPSQSQPTAVAEAPFPPAPAPLGLAPSEGAAPNTPNLGSHQSHWQGSLGVRSSYVTHSGFDAFASSNSLVAFSVGLGRTVLVEGGFSAAVLLYWELGARSGTARGATTQLTAHRWGLGPELRWHLVPRFYVFGRPSLALHYLRTELDDAAAMTTLHSAKASAGFDVSGGVAVQLYGQHDSSRATPRLWAIGEGGYGWSQAVAQSLRPDDDAPGPVRLEPVTLPPLALRGGFFKLAVAVTY
jgi:hypothetical protein